MFPVAYRGLKIITSLSLRFPDFQRQFGRLGKTVLLQVEVTESALKFLYTVPKQKFLTISDEEVVKLISFTDITEIRYHSKKGQFIVSLVNDPRNVTLFRYYSQTEKDAQQFIDSVQALIDHKVDPHNPIALKTPLGLGSVKIKEQIKSLESFLLTPNVEKFAIAEPNLLSALNNIEQASGENHTKVGEFTNSLAAVYQSLGKYEQAEPLYTRHLS